MKSLLWITAVSLLSAASLLAGDVNVKGYHRKDGTYVAPHTRSEPNAYKWDNKSYEPSQPAYNDSYSKPTKNYGSDWYTPSSTRHQDSNPNNDNPPAGSYKQRGFYNSSDTE